jgi:glycosyltransferase involved in cell wall biosynthesis
LPAYHDVTVLTRSNNQHVIEQHLDSGKRHSNPKFVYLDLPEWILCLKKAGVLPVYVYYMLWQLAASRKIRRLGNSFDIIHHVTFNSFRFPGAWWSSGQTVILGPLGGGSITATQFRRCYGSRWILEKIREYSIRFWKINPWTARSLRNAKAILVVGDELRNRFESAGLNTEAMLETALPQGLENRLTTTRPEARRNFLWVGNLEPWKGWQIAIEAFAMATNSGLGNSKLVVIGKGSQRSAAHKYAGALGVSEQVVFMEHLPRDEVWNLMAKSRALVFSSVRDTSGNVVIEAMGLNCPVICFEHQGVAMITDENCAIRVKPRKWNDSVRDFCSAILSIAENDELVERMGNAGRRKATEEHSWDTKIKFVLHKYDLIVGASEDHASTATMKARP